MHERRAIRFGLVMISFAVVWKLMGSGALTPAVAVLRRPELVSLLMYLESGRVVQVKQLQPITRPTRPSNEATLPSPPATESTEPEHVAAVFAPEEGTKVKLHDSAGLEADTQAALSRTLNWDLTGADPTVLILHTHATESFTKNGESYEESSRYRTLDEGYNMIRVGDELSQTLAEYGITVIHDRTLHDYPSYTASYNNSRKAAQKYLEQYPSIRLVLDVHRDSVELANGRQMDTTASRDGTEAAQLMMVVGTNAGGLAHPGWQENFALALKLHAQLERQMPGIMRPVNLRSERFNQDLLPGMLLVEVGAAGNTLEEALAAAVELAHAIGALRYGANID